MAFSKQLKQIYARITRNRLTAVFFLFGLIHCIAQGVIQSFLFTIDTQYYNLLFSITRTADNRADIPPSKYANYTNLVYVPSGGFELEICDFIPHNKGNCSYIFNSNAPVNSSNGPATDAILNGEIVTSHLNPQDFSTSLNSNSDVIFEAAKGAGSVTFSQTCTNMLLYPTQHLQNSRREDIVFGLLQIWLFGLSIMAMMYDSVPHVLTVFIVRLSLTAWSTYELWRTGWQQSIFYQMYEESGTPCSVNMFMDYFATRVLYEIPDLILNCTALGISAYLSWTLLRTYNAETFTTVGAPKPIMKMYKYFLALQVCLQLEVFVLITAAALWADQLFNSYITHMSNHTKIYEAIILFYAIIVGPWLFMGHHGIRFEKRVVLAAFLCVDLLFILGSSLMFLSDLYQWTFYAWPCLGCFITGSLLLLVASFVLGLVCFINFGKGLSQYLYAEANLSSSNFASEVFERDVESTYVGDENLKASGFHADFSTHYLPTLGPDISRDSFLSG